MGGSLRVNRDTGERSLMGSRSGRTAPDRRLGSDKRSPRE